MGLSLFVVGLGANLGAREAAFRAAIDLLQEGGAARVEACSRLYDTAPVGPAQPRYLNAALRVVTDLAPEALLGRALEVERALGRDRAHEARWGPRSLDIDLLWASSGPTRTPSLELPHPRLAERVFALAPLLDVAPPEAASVYGPRLRALGGAPSGAILEAGPAVTRGEDPDGAWVEGRGRDAADAVAALGALDGGPGTVEGPLSSRPIATDDGLPGLARSLDAVLAGGARVRWLALTRYDGEHVRGVARIGLEGHAPPRRVRSLEVGPAPGGGCVARLAWASPPS